MAQLKASSPAASSRIRRQLLQRGSSQSAPAPGRGGWRGTAITGWTSHSRPPGAGPRRGEPHRHPHCLRRGAGDGVRHGHQLRRAAGGGGGGAGDGEGLESCTAESLPNTANLFQAECKGCGDGILNAVLIKSNSQYKTILYNNANVFFPGPIGLQDRKQTSL